MSDFYGHRPREESRNKPPYGYRRSPRPTTARVNINNNNPGSQYSGSPVMSWNNTATSSQSTSPKSNRSSLNVSATATTTTAVGPMSTGNGPGSVNGASRSPHLRNNNNVNNKDSANEQWRAWRPAEETTSTSSTTSSPPTWFSPMQTASSITPSGGPMAVAAPLRNRNSPVQQPQPVPSPALSVTKKESILPNQNGQQYQPSPSMTRDKPDENVSNSTVNKYNTIMEEDEDVQGEHVYGQVAAHKEEKRKHSMWSDDWDDGYEHHIYSDDFIPLTTKKSMTADISFDTPPRSGWSPEPPEEEEENEDRQRHLTFYFVNNKQEPRNLSIGDICVQIRKTESAPLQQQQQQQHRHHCSSFDGFNQEEKHHEEEDETFTNGPQLRRGAPVKQEQHNQQQKQSHSQNNQSFMSPHPGFEQPAQVFTDTSSPFMYPVFFGKPSPDHYQQYNDDSSTTTAKRLNGNKWWNDNTFHGFSYPPYLSAKEIEIQSNSGELHIGTLRISRYRRYDAYVSASSLDDDIYVGSELCRNRAFDGDVVAIQLMDVDTVWKQRKEAAQRYLARNGFNTDSPEDEEDAVDLGDAEDEEETGEMLGYKPKYVGKVVGIVERPRERIVVGVLTLSRISESNASSTNELHKVWFRPLDKRTPLFYIPVGNGPTDILQNEDYYKSHLYVAKMLAWQPHKVRPVGKIIRELGQIGDMSVETNAILTDCCIATKPYSEMALATIPPLPFTIPEAEFDKRSDMREIATFTIDPSTAKDLDDALHIKRFMDTFEVGVHIADVSYFVRPNTPLDSEAKERGTSTYLVDNVLPMLPETLCQDLCSLKAGEDRLAFSVIWRMDKEANVIDTSFFKTIIRSNAQLSYEDAQNVLEGGHLDPSIPRATEIEQSIHDLMELAGHLRRRRFKAGALAIDTLKLEYKLEGGEPISVSSYQRMDAHGLIEEFMLQANLSTAKKISKHYPNEALLRRHRHPIIRRMNEFVELAQDLGFEIDAETAGSLQKSFDNIPGGEIKQALFALAIRPMQRAKYFCAGTMDPTEWLHYALNEKSYTHFTSPIRRYADITIHRQLEYAMNSKKMSGYNKASVQSIAFHCNYRKELAGRAQELNNHLYLCRYLSQKATQPAIVSATVIVVELDFIEVYQHTYGLKRRLYVEDLPLTQNEFDSDQNTVTWYWKQGVMVDMESHMRRMHRLPISKHQRNHVDEEALSNTNSSSNAKTKTTTIKKRVDTKLRAPPKQLIPSLLDKEACTQTFSVFSTLNIRLQVNSARSPPVINAYPINPFY